MLRQFTLTILLSVGIGAVAQEATSTPRFEVATIKPADPDTKEGRFFRMENDHRFVAKNYTVKMLLAVAFDLNPKAISGGPAWMDADKFSIAGVTPGDTRPTRDEQMAMLRDLLMERMNLRFHREQKEFSIYVLSVAKGGPKLKESKGGAPNVVCTVYPERIVLPARNVTLKEVTLMMQRAIFDRPVVDRTGLTAKYDFDLQWAPDDSQFGGAIPAATEKATDPPLFVAIEEQLGLKLEPTRGTISTMVVDAVEKPGEN